MLSVEKCRHLAVQVHTYARRLRFSLSYFHKVNPQFARRNSWRLRTRGFRLRSLVSSFCFTATASIRVLVIRSIISATSIVHHTLPAFCFLQQLLSSTISTLVTPNLCHLYCPFIKSTHNFRAASMHCGQSQMIVLFCLLVSARCDVGITAPHLPHCCLPPMTRAPSSAVLGLVSGAIARVLLLSLARGSSGPCRGLGSRTGQ